MTEQSKALGAPVDLVLGPLVEVRAVFEAWFLERYSYTPAVLNHPRWEGELQKAREAFDGGRRTERKRCEKHLRDLAAGHQRAADLTDNSTVAQRHDAMAAALLAAIEGPNAKLNGGP
jgi:hypothetical protein